jgi:hypothetical protein
MVKRRSKIIAVIGYFYVFGAIILLISLGTKQNIDFNIRFGIPAVPELAVRLTLAFFTLFMAYAYLKQTALGFWTMEIYSLAFVIISLCQFNKYNDQLFWGNALFSIFVLVVTAIKRNYFFRIEKQTEGT